MMMRRLTTIAIALLGMAAAAQAQTPQRVTFPSNDGKTTLTGYLFLPPAAQPGAPAQKLPAIVMMHGRAGAYPFNYSS
jgi:dipeptidyl aminopeptidase/acylaminoacyl peptidase